MALKTTLTETDARLVRWQRVPTSGGNEIVIVRAWPFVDATQAHSLAEGVFKSDRISIGDGCTLGPAAFLHYGTRVGHGAVIETESFLMKGEGVPAGQRWYANPARPVPALVPAPVAEASISDAPVDVPGPGPSEAPSPLADPSELFKRRV